MAKRQAKLMNEAEKLGDDNYSASIRSGSSIATNGNKDYDFTHYQAEISRSIQVILIM